MEQSTRTPGGRSKFQRSRRSRETERLCSFPPRRLCVRSDSQRPSHRLRASHSILSDPVLHVGTTGPSGFFLHLLCDPLLYDDVCDCFVSCASIGGEYCERS
jgi:hypothetical protein